MIIMMAMTIMIIVVIMARSVGEKGGNLYIYIHEI